jgi:hypothetical protein
MESSLTEKPATPLTEGPAYDILGNRMGGKKAVEPSSLAQLHEDPTYSQLVSCGRLCCR